MIKKFMLSVTLRMVNSVLLLTCVCIINILYECSPTYCLLKSLFLLFNKIVKLLCQSDIISLVTGLAKDTAQKYTPSLKHANHI